jgi:hypothetical protein
MVNRLWAHFFGKGLIETTDDLGLLSEAPSHPELLDWLARDFVANGWNVKRLCRQIVLSATFQQDSALRPEVSTIDPHFRLLAQGPSFPLSAPVFRDFFLDATGTIDPAPGGPPVSDVETGSLRRSLYHPQPRPAPRPQREKGTDRCLVDYQQPPASPSRTLDLDALLIPSRALASRVLTEQPGDPERLVTLHLRLVGRLPAETELADLKDALNALRNSSRATTESDPLAPWSSLILNSLVEPARYQR